jgi:hypothetical protein
MTSSDNLALFMPLAASLAVLLTGVLVVYQVTHRQSSRQRKRYGVHRFGFPRAGQDAKLTILETLLVSIVLLVLFVIMIVARHFLIVARHFLTGSTRYAFGRVSGR